MNKKLLVIIPAYNEEESLHYTISNLLQAMPDVDFVVVNDGSIDNTKAICEENNYPYLNLPINTGRSSAFRCGMK